MAEHLPADGQQGMNCLFCLLVCAAFVLLIKLPLCQPTNFLAFTLLIFFPIPQRAVSERLSGA